MTTVLDKNVHILAVIGTFNNYQVGVEQDEDSESVWKTGRYEKKPAHGRKTEGGLEADDMKAHEEGSREILSPAMDILVSSRDLCGF